MHNKIKKHLKKYMKYLENLPETKANQQLMDCTYYLICEVPDTKETLNEKYNYDTATKV